MYTTPTAILCFFVLNGLLAFNGEVYAVPSQTDKAKQNNIAASEKNMEQQTPASVISSAADAKNRKDFVYYSTPSVYDYPDGKRGFFECRPSGHRCSYFQRCCGALECNRDKFYHFFGRCY